MDFNNQPRPEHRAGDADGCTGGWVCSKCGAKIEMLRFKPDPARMNTLKCVDCFKADRQSFGR